VENYLRPIEKRIFVFHAGRNPNPKIDQIQINALSKPYPMFITINDRQNKDIV
jgi:hypothetical protein